MNLIERYGMGPYYGQPEYATNWMRQVYEHRGWEVYLDRQSRPRKWFEIFVMVGMDLWCVGNFCPSPIPHIQTWKDAERKTAEMVDRWLEGEMVNSVRIRVGPRAYPVDKGKAVELAQGQLPPGDWQVRTAEKYGSFWIVTFKRLEKEPDEDE